MKNTTTKTEATETAETKTVEQLQAEIENLKLALSKAKVIKENSDYFINEKTQTATKYRNLSETKKYFENNCTKILDSMKSDLKVDMLTSKQFHEQLVKRLQ